MSDIEAELAAMREAVFATSDSELATLLGLGRSAVSQWKKRGSIPDKARARYNQLKDHQAFFLGAAGKLAGLPVEQHVRARALAIAYSYRYAERPGIGRKEARLASMAGAFDQLTLAAALLLREYIAESGLPLEDCYEILLIEENLERRMMDVLMPKLLDERLPQSR